MRLAAMLATFALSAGPVDARRIAGTRADVVKHEKVDGGATLITVSRGLADRISMSSRCELIDPKGEVVSSDCAIVRVDKTQTVVKTRAKLALAIRVQFWR